LTREIARRVRLYEVRTRRLMEGGLGGDARSIFRGRGVELDEVRAYVPGDDVRLIDWNVTARTGETFVKKHVEERDQTVVVALDASASTLCGSGEQTKRAIATEVGCVLALAAAASGDLTSLLLFTDRVERYVPPRRGARHALGIARRMLEHEPARRGTDVAAALEYLVRVLPRRAVVLLLSDFLSERYERALAIAARRHDVVALTVADPNEIELPPVGLVVLEDAETGERVEVDLADARSREAIAAAAAASRAARDRAISRAGVERIDLVAGEPYDAALRRLFARQSGYSGSRKRS
jgi:uncharacterized protein (DUF58 family)